jgi:hypothetical protein
MLDENDLIQAVSLHLLERGFAIVRDSSKDRQGADLIVRDPELKVKMFIWATGIVRSEAGSEMSCTESEAFSCVTRSIEGALTISKTTDQFNPGDQIGLAFPDTPTFRKYLTAERPVIDGLGIKIFLVTEKKHVVVL